MNSDQATITKFLKPHYFCLLEIYRNFFKNLFVEGIICSAIERFCPLDTLHTRLLLLLVVI